MEEVVVQARSDSLLTIGSSATEGTVGRDHLESRPILRPGELLETVPGVMITQHSGGGKANQYFLRGFNLDHGTDFASYLDGIPINLPSHAHGQGYSDLNSIIPELVMGVDYQKGPYFADQGDFSSAGAANIRYVDTLSQGIAKAEIGSFGYARLFGADSQAIGKGNVLYGFEAAHEDGPWVNPDDYQKYNGIVRYREGDEDNGYRLTIMAYGGTWNSTDQIPQRAVDQGSITEFGNIDPTDGGKSNRYTFSGECYTSDADTTTKLLVYSYYYDMSLYSDFTFIHDDPVNGDQFEQKDKRVVSGLRLSQERSSTWFNRDVKNTYGLQFRNDRISNALLHTSGQQVVSTTRSDVILESSVGPYFENKTQWFDQFRTVFGLRGDIFHFDVVSDALENTDHSTKALISPKGSMIFGPWEQTEFYLNGGFGYHSNDARAVTSTLDPGTGNSVPNASGLVQTRGAEIGVRTLMIPNLQSTVSLWTLDVDSELVFAGDSGAVEIGRPSRRYGLEWANYYTPTRWLTLDLDFSASQARFRDSDPAGDHVPEAIDTVLSAGISVHDLGGFFSSFRARYFGPRDLIEDASVRSHATLLFNYDVGYQFSNTWTLTFTILNITDSNDHDIDYFYESQLPGESGPLNDIHFHPVEPREFRAALTARF